MATAFPRLRKVYADNTYDNEALKRRVAGGRVAYEAEIGAKPKGKKGLEPMRIRWAVEQAHACHGRCRRLIQDYERLSSSSGAWLQLVAVQRMIRRPVPGPNDGRARFGYPEKAEETA